MKNIDENLLEHGDDLFCWRGSVISLIIKTCTGSKFSHTARVLKENHHTVIIDAQSNGVNPKTYSNWKKKYDYSFIVLRYKYKNEQWNEEITDRCYSKMGITGYDKWSLCLWFPIYLLTGFWFGKAGLRAENKMYCSEFNGWSLKRPFWYKMSPLALYLDLIGTDMFNLIENESDFEKFKTVT